MSRLHELSIRLTAKSELESLLYEILDATIDLQHADFGNIQVYDPKRGRSRCMASRTVVL
jgi:hypothetical protein